jgi:hypothetical protein
MNPLEQLLWGFLGSAAVEVVLLYRYYRKGARLPPRYQSAGFWLIRSLLALMAGGLVVAYGIQAPLLAFHLGACTPLVVQSLTQTSQRFL